METVKFAGVVPLPRRYAEPGVAGGNCRAHGRSTGRRGSDGQCVGGWRRASDGISETIEDGPVSEVPGPLTVPLASVSVTGITDGRHIARPKAQSNCSVVSG